MAPRLRRLALLAHITTTVGWIGAVAVFLVLAVIGVTSREGETVRAVYLVMEPTAWLTLVPLALASVVTGLVQSLGTVWGLFRHYWVLFKLLITVVATAVLLTYMETFAALADAAAAAPEGSEQDALGNASPLLHAVLALAVLLVALTLAVYKPRGLTPYGRRKQRRPAIR